ncbi:DUF4410 domain-containing protein [Granulicella sp. S156]|uniref:DUF4410 domain-containing protein n=1 Tax=Granulicella sp. S156 TaxID=1747224 RepID=UPI00131CF28F|nr:DUF4410 domain-containing protein [Granulicella sp. S156]
MKVHLRFLLVYTLLAAVASIDFVPFAHAEAHGYLASSASAQSAVQDNNASSPSPAGAQDQPARRSPEPESQQLTAVLRFAVQSQHVTDPAALSAQACPQPDGDRGSANTSPPPANLNVDPKILDAVSDEMQKKLSKKMTVLVNPDPATIPVGATVITGCITRVNSGNAATRLIGMNVGASHLGVHIVVLSRTKDSWIPMDTFDIQVKGGDLLPPIGPIGLVVHAARDTQQTLSADAKKLADKVLKQFAKDTKAREQAATIN